MVLAQEGPDEEELELTAGEAAAPGTEPSEGAASTEGPAAADAELGEEPAQPIPFPYADVPAADDAKVQAAITRLESVVNSTNPPDAGLFQCLVSALPLVTVKPSRNVDSSAPSLVTT